MTTVGLVVADTGAPPEVAGEVLRAAQAELRPNDRWAWVSDRQPPVFGGSWTRADASESRGRLYARGLGWASALGMRAVAFTDCNTRLEPGWRAAVADAFHGGADVAGGPVLPGVVSAVPRRSVRSWAGFLVEYGPHAAPPFTSASGDFSANNVAYRMEVLDDPGEELWKSVVDAELRGQRRSLVLVPGMVAASVRSYSLRNLTVDRFAAGRLYGAQSGLRCSRARRAARVVLASVLPIVRFHRTTKTAWNVDELRSAYWRAAPLVALAEVAWSAGEAAGFLRPSRPPQGVR